MVSYQSVLSCQDVENELVVQVSMKQEMELAMKLLEKDIHEKQDTLIGLRHQLDEVKAINVEMYQKMQVRALPTPYQSLSLSLSLSLSVFAAHAALYFLNNLTFVCHRLNLFSDQVHLLYVVLQIRSDVVYCPLSSVSVA